jgi:hypothetical protein
MNAPHREYLFADLARTAPPAFQTEKRVPGAQAVEALPRFCWMRLWNKTQAPTMIENKDGVDDPQSTQDVEIANASASATFAAEADHIQGT